MTDIDNASISTDTLDSNSNIATSDVTKDTVELTLSEVVNDVDTYYFICFRLNNTDLAGKVGVFILPYTTHDPIILLEDSVEEAKEYFLHTLVSHNRITQALRVKLDELSPDVKYRLKNSKPDIEYTDTENQLILDITNEYANCILNPFVAAFTGNISDLAEAIQLGNSAYDFDLDSLVDLFQVFLADENACNLLKVCDILPTVYIQKVEEVNDSSSSQESESESKSESDSSTGSSASQTEESSSCTDSTTVTSEQSAS